jgi:hypothetical protein
MEIPSIKNHTNNEILFFYFFRVNLWEHLLLINYIICQNFSGCWRQRIDRVFNRRRKYSHAKGIKKSLNLSSDAGGDFFFFWVNEEQHIELRAKQSLYSYSNIPYIFSMKHFHFTLRIFFIRGHIHPSALT